MTPAKETPREDQASPTAVARPTGAHASARPNTTWLSTLKVIAITAVIVIHIVGATASLDGARSSRVGQAAVALQAWSVFSVPLFVMVSGALLLNPARYRGTADFLRRRAVRLLPALVVWHLFYVGFRAWALDQDLTGPGLLNDFLTANVYTALYYFWIALGLVLIAPLLMPWLASAPRPAVLGAGALLAMVPILTHVTAPYAGASLPRTPWTLWLPFLGYFVLGWALRGVVLRGRALAGASVALAAILACLIYAWGNDGLPVWFERLAAASFQGPLVHVYAVLIFLVVQSVVRDGGVVAWAARGRTAAITRALGDATLGVFVSHLVVLHVVVQTLPQADGRAYASSVGELLLRIALVWTATYALVLSARRVPVLGRVL